MVIFSSAADFAPAPDEIGVSGMMSLVRNFFFSAELTSVGISKI
jgi:hypothetical protein